MDETKKMDEKKEIEKKENFLIKYTAIIFKKPALNVN